MLIISLNKEGIINYLEDLVIIYLMELPIKLVQIAIFYLKMQDSLLQ